MRNLPPISGPQIKAMEEHYRARLRSLQAIDDMVETVVSTLERTGQLQSTYIIYTSDNGLHMGEHRMIAGKTTAYEEDIRVPMIVRGPGVPRRRSGSTRSCSTTISRRPSPRWPASLRPSFVDGRSLLPLFENPAQPWRHSFLIQRRELETHEMTGAGALRCDPDRGLDVRPIWRRRAGTLQYPAATLISSTVWSAAPSRWSAELLATRLAELMNCAGADCREIEDRLSMPSGRRPASPPSAGVVDAVASGRRAP